MMGAMAEMPTENTPPDPDVCVWCGEARANAGTEPGEVLRRVSMATPPCEHETLDGRR